MSPSLSGQFPSKKPKPNNLPVPKQSAAKAEKCNRQKPYNRTIHNRLRAIMSHATRYSFKGEARLAEDTGVSRASISRLSNNQSCPSFPLVCALAKALSQELGKRIDPSDIVSCDGTYPTRFVCQLCGCKGCLPNAAYDEEENRRPEYAHIQPGKWSTEDFPTFGESEVE